jgi:adenylate cyclase
LADPGGICISKTAFDHIETKLPFGYEYLGQQTVKNIARPVGAYKVLMQTRVTGEKGKTKPKRGAADRYKNIVARALIVVVTIVGGLIWNLSSRQTKIEPASVEKMAYPLPEKPSIVVLPFANLSGDPTQEFLSDGITENLINVLSAFPNLFVIAGNSSFAYKGKPTRVQQVAEALGVRYVLEGSVAAAGGRIRITRMAAKEVLRINPRFSVGQYRKILTIADPVARDRYLQALHKAGLPESNAMHSIHPSNPCECKLNVLFRSMITSYQPAP